VCIERLPSKETVAEDFRCMLLVERRLAGRNLKERRILYKTRFEKETVVIRRKNKYALCPL
jgi:hypothetical protein